MDQVPKSGDLKLLRIRLLRPGGGTSTYISPSGRYRIYLSFRAQEALLLPYPIVAKSCHIAADGFSLVRSAAGLRRMNRFE